MKKIIPFSALAISGLCYLASCNKPQPETHSEVTTDATVPAEETAVKAEMTTDEMIKNGGRLVTITGCDDCHSPKKMTDQGPVPEESVRLSGHPGDLALPAYDPANVKAGWTMTNQHFTAWVGPWGVSF